MRIYELKQEIDGLRESINELYERAGGAPDLLADYERELERLTDEYHEECFFAE